MSYTITEHDQAIVLAIHGRFLGSIERDAWRRAIDELAAGGRVRLVIDLSKAEFMDSAGVGLMVRAAETVRKAGGEIRLAGMQARVKNFFVMARLLGSLFVAYPTVDDAFSSFAQPPRSPLASGRE